MSLPLHLISYNLYLIKKELLAVHPHVTSSNFHRVPKIGSSDAKWVMRRMTKQAPWAVGHRLSMVQAGFYPEPRPLVTPTPRPTHFVRTLQGPDNCPLP